MTDVPNKISTHIQRRPREAAAAAVGAAGAQGLYQGSAYGVKWASQAKFGRKWGPKKHQFGENVNATAVNSINAGERPKPFGMDPKYLNTPKRKEMEASRKEHTAASSVEHVGGSKSLFHKPPTEGTNWGHYYRNLPKKMDLPLHSAQKVMGYTHHGRAGEATGAAVMAAGAVGAAMAVHHHYNVGKSAAPTADDFFGFEEVSKKKTDWNQMTPVHGALLGAVIGHPVGGTIGAVRGHKDARNYRGVAFEHEVAANNYHVLNTHTPEGHPEFHAANAAQEAAHLHQAKAYKAAALGKELEGFHTGSKAGMLAGAGVGAAGIAIHHHYHVHKALEMPH